MIKKWIEKFREGGGSNQKERRKMKKGTLKDYEYDISRTMSVPVMPGGMHAFR